MTKSNLLLPLLLLGCSPSREELQINAPAAIAFHSPGKLRISNQANEAEKRGFADFTGDGVTDMIELVDLVWFGQEWVGRIFKGERTPNGLVTFLDPYQVSLPINEEWFTSQTKFDTADINGDGFADVVIAQLDDDKYTIQVGINVMHFCSMRQGRCWGVLALYTKAGQRRCCSSEKKTPAALPCLRQQHSAWSLRHCDKRWHSSYWRLTPSFDRPYPLE